MKLKKSKIESNETTDIIMTTESSVSYVDEEFFHTKMKEEKDTGNDRKIKLMDDDIKTYAVKIQGIKADWIINEKEGIQFL